MTKKNKQVTVRALANFTDPTSPTGRRQVGEVFETSPTELGELKNRTSIPLVEEVALAETKVSKDDLES